MVRPAKMASGLPHKCRTGGRGRAAAIAEGLFEREGRAWMNLPRRRSVGPIRISAKRAEFALIHRPTADTRSRNVKLSEMKEVANGGVLNHPGICGYVVPDPLFRAGRSTICNNYAASQQRPLYPAKSWDEPSKPLRGSASRFGPHLCMGWQSGTYPNQENYGPQPFHRLWQTHRTISSSSKPETKSGHYVFQTGH